MEKNLILTGKRVNTLCVEMRNGPEEGSGTVLFHHRFNL